MLIKNMVLKGRYILTFSSLALLVACGSSSSNDPTTATYDVSFTATWGADTHPTNIPPGVWPDTPSAPHYSPIVVATHNNQVILWENGQPASAGTQIIAETGNPTTFLEEADAAIAAGTANSAVRGAGSFISPGEQSVTIEAHSDFPQVTFLTMIAASPDWFAGAHVESLLTGGSFVDTLTVDVMAYDAGTDDGNSYLSANDATLPRGFIQGLITDPTDTSFDSEAQRKVGELTFTKQ